MPIYEHKRSISTIWSRQLRYVSIKGGLEMIKNLENLVAKLKNNSKVISIIEYGNRSFYNSSGNGDYDIFVIVEERLYSIESLHFYINDIPVDLNIRTIEDLKKEEPLSFIDSSIFKGRIIYDKNDVVHKLKRESKQKWKEKEDKFTEYDIAFERFSKKHVLDKVQRRLDSDPILCNLLLNTNIYWLLQSYFKFNNLIYPGEKKAISYIKENDPDIYKRLKEFYQKNDLEEKLCITEKMTDLVLKNIGGLWKQDEIIAFGINKKVNNLKGKGKKVYDILLKPRNCL